MDRNTVIGLVLIAVILITSTFLFKATDEATQKPETVMVDTLANEQVAATEADTATVKDSVTVNVPADFAAFAKGTNQVVKLENEDVKLEVSSKGGRITYVELKKYKTHDGKPLVLLNEASSNYGFQIPTGTETVNTEDLYFTPVNATGRSVTMQLEMAGGKAIKQTYALDNEGYMVKNQFVLQGMQTVIPKRDVYIDLTMKGRVLKNEKDSTIASQNTTIHYRNIDEDPDYLSETSDDNEKFKSQTDWVSLKQQFFCQTLISSKQPFINADLTTEASTDKNYLKNLTAQLTLPYNHTNLQQYDMAFYFGPLHFKTLKKLDLDLEKQIPLGWSFAPISWVNRFMVIPVFNFLSQFMGNFGIIILLLTIFIKLIVLPLTYKSYLSTAKMKLLKPELDELKAKHEGDLPKQQQEQMKLYRKAGVSPFGGCLPLLLQMPILIAMFRFFPSSIELRQEKFLWADDLSTYDSIYTLPFTIPYYGDHVSLFTILMTISTLIYTRLNNSLSNQPKEFIWMSYVMPIFFLGFFNNYAAGLSMYYFFFNVLTFGQQYLFKLFIDEKKLMAKIEENKKKPVTKGGFQKRLEDMAKRQQQMQQQRGQGKKGGKR